MIVPAPLQRLANGRLRLDTKFVSGMQAHLAHWPGQITVVIEEGGAVPFGRDYDPQELGFELFILPSGTQDLIGAIAPLLNDAVGIYASADMHNVFDDLPLPVVFSLEYTLKTRLEILRLDPALSRLRKLWSGLWNRRIERKRLRALRRAAGVQCNGYPALAAYGGLNPEVMLYLDGRMRSAMMASPTEMAAKADHQGPLRLVHSGRLEPMKGAQDLLPVLHKLDAAGVDYRCDIFGTGQLEAAIRSGIDGLGGRVILHQPVDFETVLVPWMRKNADVFLSCHRQADPSCSYLEAMGCGLPIVGYSNDMWSKMAQESGGGWVVPLGDQGGLVQQLIALAAQPKDVITAAERALQFAKRHDFESEFARRMHHLHHCLGGVRTDR